MSGVLAVVSKPCTICTKNNFPNELVNVEPLGNDPATGKMKWKVTNADGSEHVHKGGKVWKPNPNTEIWKEIRDILTRIESKLGSKE